MIKFQTAKGCDVVSNGKLTKLSPFSGWRRVIVSKGGKKLRISFYLRLLKDYKDE